MRAHDKRASLTKQVIRSCHGSRFLGARHADASSSAGAARCRRWHAAKAATDPAVWSPGSLHHITIIAVCHRDALPLAQRRDDHAGEPEHGSLVRRAMPDRQGTLAVLQ